MSDSLDLSALGFVSAWERSIPIPGGIAHETALRSCRLDFTIASLDRIDRFIGALRQRVSGQGDVFLEAPANRNLLWLLAFYAGELVGRARGHAPQWHNWQGLIRHQTIVSMGAHFLNSAQCRFPGDGELKLPWYMPLHALLPPLFDASAPGLRAATAPYLPQGLQLMSPLPACPAQGLDVDWPLDFATLPRAEGAELLPHRPQWILGDPLNYQFESVPTLFSQGRVVWAALVQANDDLFRIGSLEGAPGVVLYDPAGRIDQPTLGRVARQVFALKGKPNEDADVAAMGAALANETSRMFDHPVPPSISAYPLRVSALQFDRRHLPDGLLSMGTFPIVISDQCPGAVMVLPAPRWQPQWREQWQEVSARAHGRKLDAGRTTEAVKQQRLDEIKSDPEQSAVFAERLFQEGFAYANGKGVKRDVVLALRLLEEAGRHGHMGAINNLGCMYSTGDGVKVDHVRAHAYFLRAAQLGHRESQLNLGISLWEGRTGQMDQIQALQWIEKAAEQGSPEAKNLLETRPRQARRGNMLWGLLRFVLKGVISLFLRR